LAGTWSVDGSRTDRGISTGGMSEGFPTPKADCSGWNIVAQQDVYCAQSCNASSTLRTTDWSLTKDTYDAEQLDCYFHSSCQFR